MRVYSFEKLDVWQEGRIWVKWIYLLTKEFPAEEKFGLVSQIRRAAISVVANLAEGCSRRSPKDQAHFSQISYSSLLEVLNHLLIAGDLEYFQVEKMLEGRAMISSLTYKINMLRNSQLKRAGLLE